MKVRIEKQSDGSYIAYNKEAAGMVAIGTGATIGEAKSDFENSLNEMAEDMTDAEREKFITKPEYSFDVSSLFEYYKVINVSAFAGMIGINKSLLLQYKRGDTYISDRQLEKIEKGIHALGAELCALKLR